MEWDIEELRTGDKEPSLVSYQQEFLETGGKTKYG